MEHPMVYLAIKAALVESSRLITDGELTREEAGALHDEKLAELKLVYGPEAFEAAYKVFDSDLKLKLTLMAIENLWFVGFGLGFLLSYFLCPIQLERVLGLMVDLGEVDDNNTKPDTVES